MKTAEIVSGLLSWLFAAFGMLWALIYGLANSNPHGSSAPRPIPFHLFFLPAAGAALAIFVLHSTRKRGIIAKGLLLCLLPLVVSLITILLGMIACSNAG